MSSYFSMPGVDTGVPSTANSADVKGNLNLRLAVGGNEAGILVEEPIPGDEPHFVAIYFPTDALGELIPHMQALH